MGSDLPHSRKEEGRGHPSCDPELSPSLLLCSWNQKLGWACPLDLKGQVSLPHYPCSALAQWACLHESLKYSHSAVSALNHHTEERVDLSWSRGSPTLELRVSLPPPEEKRARECKNSRFSEMDSWLAQDWLLCKTPPRPLACLEGRSGHSLRGVRPLGQSKWRMSMVEWEED